MSYLEAKAKYEFSPFDNELAKRITRMQDFDMLDFEIGEIEEKPTAEQVEQMLDRLNVLLAIDEEYFAIKVGHLRDVIYDVMGRGYLS